MAWESPSLLASAVEGEGVEVEGEGEDPSGLGMTGESASLVASTDGDL